MKRRILAAVMAVGCAVSLWFGTGTNGYAMTDLDVSEVVSKNIQEPEEFTKRFIAWDKEVRTNG